VVKTNHSTLHEIQHITYFANVRSGSGGSLPRKHSLDGATWAHIRNRPATHLSTPEGWKVELA